MTRDFTIELVALLFWYLIAVITDMTVPKLEEDVDIRVARQALGTAILLVQVPGSQSVIVRLAYDLIRNNLIGTPEFFREQKWAFDPEVAKRREPEYTRRNGIHSEYTIERLGLGTDGYQDIRREEQRLKDRDVTTQLPHINGYYGITPQAYAEGEAVEYRR